MSKIKTINITNIKAISQFNLPLDGATVVLTGGNNKGKSTILKCMIDRLRGEKPELILRDTTKNGFGVIELTDGNKFTWNVSPDGIEELTMITNDGRTFKATKDVNSIYFPKVFDIDEFLNKPPREKLKDIKSITGLDLDLIEAEYKEAYEYRSIMNRVKKEAEAKRVDIDFGLPNEELSTEELVREMATIQAHNDKVDMVERSRQDKKDRIVKLQEEINQLTIGEESEFLWLKENPTKPISFDSSKRLEDMRVINRSIFENNKARSTELDYQKAQDDYDVADKLVTDLHQKKLDQIAQSKLPEGFNIVEGGLLYNGLPLERSQQSSSSLYIAGLKLAKEMLGEVRTLHFDASFLDKNSLNDIWKWAQSEDLQLMIERPDYDGGEITYKFLKS